MNLNESIKKMNQKFNQLMGKEIIKEEGGYSDDYHAKQDLQQLAQSAEKIHNHPTTLDAAKELASISSNIDDMLLKSTAFFSQKKITSSDQTQSIISHAATLIKNKNQSAINARSGWGGPLNETIQKIKSVNKMLEGPADYRKLNEELAWASDGGYYNAPERSTYITSKDLAELKQAAENVYRSLSGEMNDGICVASNEWESSILKGLQINGTQLEYDVHPHQKGKNENYYWLSNPAADKVTLRQDIDDVVASLYDKVDDRYLDNIQEYPDL